jgi:hypothetical protein
MRFVLAFAFATLVVAPAASAATDKTLDAQQMAALANKAAQASPKEQCFMYAELAHSMLEQASQQLSAGDTAKASASLKAVQMYAEKIHMGVADDAHKLKNAEILMRHTAYRLKELMMGASLEDRPTLESTLKQLDQVEAEMMMQVFKH